MPRLQHSMLGNYFFAPLPPRSGRYRVVLRITTEEPICWRTLRILETTANNTAATTAPAFTTTTTTSSSSSSLLPPPLRGGPIGESEYQDKLRLLETRLLAWRGGREEMIISWTVCFYTMSVLVALFTKQFWWSNMFSLRETWPIVIMVLVLFVPIAVCCLLYMRTKRETARMIDDIKGLYHEWYSRGVHVTMKQVSDFGETSETAYESYAGRPCFCVIMTVAHEGAVGAGGSAGQNGTEGRGSDATTFMSLESSEIVEGVAKDAANACSNENDNDDIEITRHSCNV